MSFKLPSPQILIITFLLLGGAAFLWYVKNHQKPTEEELQQPLKAEVAVLPQPLTDVAPAQPKIEIPPRSRAVISNSTAYVEPPPQAPVIYPKDEKFDPHNPPEWTQPLAKPKLYPTPPDPYKPPPIKVDPERRPEKDQ